MAYVAARNETEEQLARMWQQVLEVDQVGVEDNYFDLGGDSITATQLISRINDAFGVHISLNTFFDSPTISEMALVIVQVQASQADSEAITRLLAEIKQESGSEV
ncbi:MAG TPA: phosphopantetheine-binding protein [Pyrinomonadaceae bacterium]|nr:phosphopantetheine-binding protein [Pyrinomonadaceae bacterium]